jgi:hypothetical protein
VELLLDLVVCQGQSQRRVELTQLLWFGRVQRLRDVAELVDVRLEFFTGQTRSAHEPASAADGSGG